MQNPVPKKIEQSAEDTLRISWKDGKVSDFDVAELRRACQCAACVDEITREPILRPEDVADSVRPVRVRSMGRYALNIDWDDGHQNTIYSWERLYALANEIAE